MRMSIALLIVLFFAALNTSNAQEQKGLIVTTDWLANNLNDPNLVVLHVAGTRREYLNGHILGSRFLWTGSFAQDNPELTFEVVPVSKLVSALEDLGITNKSKIILCFSRSSVTMATRMFVTLDFAGLGAQTSFLDGGFELWKSEDRPISKEAPLVKHSTLTPVIKNSAVVTVETVKSAIGDPNTAIIDARAERFYQGAPGGFSRGGHIPGAVNIPFSGIVDSTNKFLSYTTLKTMFEKAGVTTGKKVIAYCHIGQQATLVYFASRYLGHEASLYDGSFEDWSSREELPLETPPAKSQ
ncbi:MAG: rhodanese-like domain-containing protein [Bacteroidota bacterium]